MNDPLAKESIKNRLILINHEHDKLKKTLSNMYFSAVRSGTNPDAHYHVLKDKLADYAHETRLLQQTLEM